MQSSYLLLAAMIPFIIFDNWYPGTSVLSFIKDLVIMYIILFGILPLIFHYSYTIQAKFIFCNINLWPFPCDLSKPEELGLIGARHLYLYTDEEVKLGVWHILPKNVIKFSSIVNNEDFDESLRDSRKPVFIYMHGNGGNRASGIRLKIYKLFQYMDYHVVCFDYRNYGDSSKAHLSETGVVNDAKYIIEWVMNIVDGNAPVFVWGHSLGTGVATHAVASLAAKDIVPAGLILEAPFNNIVDEIREHPAGKLYKHLPWFEWVIVKPFYDNDLQFESDKHIKNVACPIMILHAEDDRIIPVHLGEKLYEAGLSYFTNETDKIKMIRIDALYKLGHNLIFTYHLLQSIIMEFVDKCENNETE